MKLIIAGGRDFSNYDLLKAEATKFLAELKASDVEIVSGAARGADLLGEQFAKENRYGLKIFPADWDQYGKYAGYRRNQEMAEYSDSALCFWNGISRGTMHMIGLMEARTVKFLKVVRY